MVWPMVAVAAVSMIGSMAAGSAAAGASKDAALRNAAMVNRQMREEIERKKQSVRQIKGEIKSTIYASGIDYAGSAKQHYESESQRMREDLTSMERARFETIRNMKKGASAAHGAAMWQVAASGISGAASAFGAMSRSTTGGGGFSSGNNQQAGWGGSTLSGGGFNRRAFS